jgi:hypothetical protein
VLFVDIYYSSQTVAQKTPQKQMPRRSDAQQTASFVYNGKNHSVFLVFNVTKHIFNYLKSVSYAYIIKNIGG